VVESWVPQSLSHKITGQAHRFAATTHISTTIPTPSSGLRSTLRRRPRVVRQRRCN
jgi:hypothetical protein